MSDTDFSNYFYYDESSPSCLRWKIDIRCGKDGRILTHKAGDEAGTQLYRKGKPKCYSVVLHKKPTAVHRIILLLHGADLQTGIVDHVDGNPFNNVVSNLRVVGYEGNARNCSAYKNSTGIKGVSKVSCKNPQGVVYWYYEAYAVGLDGKLTRRKFSIQKLGEDVAFTLAAQWREDKMKYLNEHGAGYTERHLSNDAPTFLSIRAKSDIS